MRLTKLKQHLGCETLAVCQIFIHTGKEAGPKALVQLVPYMWLYPISEICLWLQVWESGQRKQKDRQSMKEGIILEMLRCNMETATDLQGSWGQRPALLCFWKSLQHSRAKRSGYQPPPVPGLPCPPLPDCRGWARGKLPRWGTDRKKRKRSLKKFLLSLVPSG